MIIVPEPEKNIVVVSGPSGSGKDTLIMSALESLPFEKVITTTSRAQREGEEEGREHYFVSEEIFKQKIAENAFVEYSQNENNAYYGVEKEHLNEAVARQKKLIWRVDWKGVKNIKKIYPEVKSVTIMAQRETLDRRVRSREKNISDETYFQERIAYAEDYFTHLSDYDYVIWNEDGTLEESIKEFKSILTKITSA
jgi:guanylate kinase